MAAIRAAARFIAQEEHTMRAHAHTRKSVSSALEQTEGANNRSGGAIRSAILAQAQQCNFRHTHTFTLARRHERRLS